jgi:hypothetical protein
MSDANDRSACGTQTGKSDEFFMLALLLLASLVSSGAVYIYKEREKSLQTVIFNPTMPSHGIYGHVHMAKTAGTTLNGEMAARFERVCGHKGYSYDSWQMNYRLNQSRHGVKVGTDSMPKVYNGYNRGRVHPAIMNEIGYEDCDYVSHETGWKFWPNTFQKWSVPIELHIPCRDPISRLMSMCNFKQRKFNCTNSLEVEIKGCLLQMDRFSSKLVTDCTDIEAKCFEAQKIDEYIEYMSSKLQNKRFPAAYFFRAILPSMIIWEI